MPKKNEGVFLSIMGNPVVPSCEDGSDKHDFAETIKPLSNRSGWHEDTCTKCGLRVGYDTSD